MHGVPPFESPRRDHWKKIIKMFHHDSFVVCLEAEKELVVSLGTHPSWLAFTDDITKYPESIKRMKQANGHARLRSAETSEIKRSLESKEIDFLLIGADTNPVKLDLFKQPMTAIILEVQDIRNPPLDLLSSLPMFKMKSVQVLPADDILSFMAYVVFYVGEEQYIEWPSEIVHSLLQRQKSKLKGVIDMFTYFNELKLVTREQCLDQQPSI
jgi:hypothetical protein